MSKGVSGIAVAILSAGALFIWSGINNQDMLTSLRYLAMGKPIPAGEQHRRGARPTPEPLTPEGKPGGYQGNQNIVSIAASMKGTPYLFGGGHGKVCPDGPMDCSGFVSCVLNKAGVMTGTLTTDGFKSWGQKVDFNDRAPGDIVVWVGGAGGGHMGIIADKDTMWHNPCTGCGGVQKASYGAYRDLRPTIVRRARNVRRVD
jgi:cell wall-associated NlpC family hydrolase